MFRSSIGKDFQPKQEGDTNDIGMFSKEPSSSSRLWEGFRNPRIVRVSRSFGGKDRHSKVRTIRGLRDRRIRLSVPTAIQLYDLQDRLGLSQPSKVIDWLLDATKHDIDKLPPLQIPPGSFGQFLQPIFSHDQSNNAPPSHSSLASFFDANSTFMKQGIININSNIDDGEDQTMMATKSKYWDLKGKSKEEVVGRESSNITHEKSKSWMKINEQDQNHQDSNIGGSCYNAQVLSAQNLFPIAHHSSVNPSLLNNNIAIHMPMPYNNPYHHWEPSNLSLSQIDQDPHNGNTSSAVLLPSSFALPSASSQLFFPPYPPHIMTTTPIESDAVPRQINHFQLLSSTIATTPSQHILHNSLNMPSFHSISSQMKSFPLNVNPKLFTLQSNNEQHESNKNDTDS